MKQYPFSKSNVKQTKKTVYSNKNMPKIKKLTDLCVQAICSDTNVEQKQCNIDSLRGKQLGFPKPWDYITLEINVEGDNGDTEHVSICLDNERLEFEGIPIMSPMDCLSKKPSFIELQISRTPEDGGLCMITWYIHYVNYTNTVLEVSYDITNSKKLDVSLQIEKDWNARLDPEIITCKFHKNKWKRRFFDILSKLYISKSLHDCDVMSPMRVNTWPSVKEYVQNIMKSNHENVMLNFDVMQDVDEHLGELVNENQGDYICLKMEYL